MTTTEQTSTIRRLRIERGWSVQQLADAAGVTRQAVYNWEAGARPMWEAGRRLAALFEIDSDDLFEMIGRDG